MWHHQSSYPALGFLEVKAHPMARLSFVHQKEFPSVECESETQ